MLKFQTLAEKTVGG